MSVLVEFTIEAEQFALGTVLANGHDLDFELERIVPTGPEAMPFVWVATDRDPADVLPEFEERIRGSARVRGFRALDRLHDGGLYRLEWGRDGDDGFLTALATAEATVLDAWGNRTWTFRVRFTDHDRLTEFHDALDRFDVATEVTRTYTLTRESARRREFGLTSDQREALALAVERGYFETPSEVSLDELADELGVTKQAVSDRIRRGNHRVLQSIHLLPASDSEKRLDV
jgi:predicted DNA binding protein